MLTNVSGIILITGIMAGGKSTVAQLLAERFEQSVHLRGDIFRKMIINNRKEVSPNGEKDELEQLRLRYRLAAQAADTYYQAGFTVVVEDVVIGPMLNDLSLSFKTVPCTLWFFVRIRPSLPRGKPAGPEKDTASGPCPLWTMCCVMKRLESECGWIRPHGRRNEP